MKDKDWIILGVVAVIAVIVYEASKAANKVSSTLSGFTQLIQSILAIPGQILSGLTPSGQDDQSVYANPAAPIFGAPPSTDVQTQALMQSDGLFSLDPMGGFEYEDPTNNLSDGTPSPFSGQSFQ